VQGQSTVASLQFQYLRLERRSKLTQLALEVSEAAAEEVLASTAKMQKRELELDLVNVVQESHAWEVKTTRWLDCVS
jgi:ABC-type phosphate transport system auxiliary subunit